MKLVSFSLLTFDKDMLFSYSIIILRYIFGYLQTFVELLLLYSLLFVFMLDHNYVHVSLICILSLQLKFLITVMK